MAIQETYYTVDQIAGMLGLHPKTVQRYIREGKLRAQKIGRGWRVTGHDLSAFVEGTAPDAPVHATPGLQGVVTRAHRGIRVSSVVDVPVRDAEEAMRVTNWIGAVLNGRGDRQDPASMSSQYIEQDRMVRIMLWGSATLTENILQSLREVGTQQEE